MMAFISWSVPIPGDRPADRSRKHTRSPVNGLKGPAYIRAVAHTGTDIRPCITLPLTQTPRDGAGMYWHSTQCLLDPVTSDAVKLLHTNVCIKCCTSTHTNKFQSLKCDVTK